MSVKGMGVLSKHGLLSDKQIYSLKFCEFCVLEKKKRVSFSTVKHTTKATLDYIHSDCGAFSGSIKR